MYCRNCGRDLPEGTNVCPGCRAPQTGYARNREPQPSVGIVDATKLYFTRYADFKGRSRRSEYWWATLAIGILGTVIGAILPDLAWIWTLATLVPSLAMCVRRLHDVGKSGWWYLISLIPLVGCILLLVWFCTDSKEDNQWGVNPKY